MKHLLITLFILNTLQVSSQIHEFGAGMGFSQYSGDLNVVNHERHPFTFLTESFNPKNYKMSYSLSYRYSYLNYISFGANFNHLYLCGYDSDNKSDKIGDDGFVRQVRNLSFFTAVNQLSADIRFEPFRTEEEWDRYKWIISPYAAAGMGIFHFNPKTKYQGEDIELQPLGTEGQGIKPFGEKYSLTQFCLPFSLGIRFIDPDRLYSIGVDFTYTYSFTDYLDDVSGNYVDPAIFKAKYSASQADLIIAMANRNKFGNDATYISYTSEGQQRGNPRQSDNFLTGQVRFSLFLDAFKQKYFRF